jgi:hypothetical protein
MSAAGARALPPQPANGPVQRHRLRDLKAFNFVIENALAGGVKLSPARDIHGKSDRNVVPAIERLRPGR